MDARIVVDAAEMGFSAPVAVVVTTIKVDELVKQLVSLFDAATILAPLLNMGNSVTAVAPDYTISRGGVSVQAAMV